MAIGNNKPFNLDKFEKQINDIANANDAELKKIQQEFNLTNQEYNKRLERLWGNQGVNDPEIDKLMEQLQSEVRLDEQEKERGRQEDQKLQERLDKLKGPIPTTEELEARLAKLKENPIPEQVQHKRLSEEGFSFNDNKDFITINLDAQTEMAKAYGEISNNPEEKKELNTAATKLGMISQLINYMPEVSKEEQPKVLEIIGKGLGKIYNGIKDGISYAIDGIKKLGGKLVESIKSIFKESPEKQLEKKRNTLKGLYENFVELKGVTGKVKEQFLEKHFNEIDKLTTPQEFLKETAKITKAIQKAGKDKLLEIKNKHIESQKALQQKYAQRSNGLSPSPTPPVNKGKSNSLNI
ncbi:MAG: hypothetical protein RCG15_01870 [Candidatus Rickettsia vulgarisii]